jgi:piezo-type mechanosensitive ion channel component 1/2
MEELNTKAEKYVTKRDGAVIHLKSVQDAFIKSKGDRQKAEFLIEAEQRRAEREALYKIYHKGDIGIFPYLEELKRRLEIEEKRWDSESRLKEPSNEERKPEEEEVSIFSAHVNRKEERKEEEIPANKEELGGGNNEEEPIPKVINNTPNWYQRIVENLRIGYMNALKKLKIFLVNYIHEIYHYENGEYQFKGKESLLVIFVYLLMSHMNKICFFFFIINHIVNTNLISMVYPFSLFFYALLENPIPQKGYWRFMILYTIIVILAKFIYQLPVFCDSPPYSIFYYTSDSQCRSASSSSFNLSPSDLINRIDFIIGKEK